MPLAMAGMPMRMVMLHANSFIMQTVEEKPRGQDAISVPNMMMLDIGSSLGDRHYVNLEVMATLERWTFPRDGTPELLQLGESKDDGTLYLDAQHPHSSPLMGLTLSDTVSIGSDLGHAKIWIAPRGESTDGPIAFMHRPTGMVNPDAPLGHHIGQDAGHISSTVLGGLLNVKDWTLEFSTFHGAEPEPMNVDLPLGSPDSYAMRLSENLSAHLLAMASAAYVKSPEPDDPTLDHIWRYSVSLYADAKLDGGWRISDAVIWGLINSYDHVSALNSFAEEFWLHRGPQNYWAALKFCSVAQTN